jgi:DMSO reductase anchor subunit
MEILLSLIPVLIIGLPFFLWVAMLVHVIKNDIPDKVLWIIVLVVGGIIGGVVYYFAIYVKQNKKAL